MLETFTLATFADRPGELFALTHGDGTLELQLHLVSAEGEPATPGARTPFSLEFLGPAAPVLPQAMYALDHPELGSFELFLVPLGPGDGGAMRYEAVFS